MTDWTIQTIKAQLEYAVKAIGENVELDPYQRALELPLTNEVLVTIHPEAVSGKTILGLKVEDAINSTFKLVRLRHHITFDFDSDDDLVLLQGAFKINYTSADTQTTATIVDTAYFPFNLDSPVEVMPPDTDFNLLLKREEVETDTVDAVYRLVRVASQDGNLGTPSCRERCNQIQNPHRRRQCLLQCATF